MQDFSAIDVGAVTAELKRFVEETTPQNASGSGFITARSNPKCGRARAIELAERLRALYAVLYPDWQTDNAESSKNFEFSRERDAAMRLLSRIDAYQEITTMLGTTALAPQMSANSLHEKVWTAAQAQWQTEHYHEAVLAAAKAVNSLLQTKIRRRDVSEVKLIREAFSERPPTPGKPRLRFPAVADEQTRDSVRQGAMDFGAGCFGAIRKSSDTPCFRAESMISNPNIVLRNRRSSKVPTTGATGATVEQLVGACLVGVLIAVAVTRLARRAH